MEYCVSCVEADCHVQSSSRTSYARRSTVHSRMLWGHQLWMLLKSMWFIPWKAWMVYCASTSRVPNVTYWQPLRALEMKLGHNQKGSFWLGRCRGTWRPIWKCFVIELFPVTPSCYLSRIFAQWYVKTFPYAPKKFADPACLTKGTKPP